MTKVCDSGVRPSSLAIETLSDRSYAVGSSLAHKWAGYVYKGHLRGLNEPAGYPLGGGLCSRS